MRCVEREKVNVSTNSIKKHTKAVEVAEAVVMVE